MVSFYERNHKKVINLLVIIFTALTIYIAINNQFNSNITFFISTIYALFLFIISNHLTTIASKIENNFYNRKEYYINLIKLKNCVNHMIISESDFYSSILMFKGFTGRFDKEKLITPYIRQNGIYFENKYLLLESKYIELYDDLKKVFSDLIVEHTGRNHVSILDMEFLLTETEKWCEKELDGNNNLELIKRHLRIAKLGNKAEIRKFSRLRKKLMKKHKYIMSKAINNITYFEEMYGSRLTESINNFDILMERVEKIYSEITNINFYIQDLEESLKSVEESSLRMNKQLNEMELIISKENENSRLW